MLSRCRIAVAFACAALVWAIPLGAQNVRNILFAEINGAPDALSQLKPTDFELTPAGVKQKIVRVSASGPAVRVAILVDTSTAAEPLLNDMRAAISGFADALPQPHEIALVAIGRNTRILEKATTNRDRIKTHAKKLFPD